MGVFNEQFDILLQESVFTNTLNLVIRSSTDDDICSLDDPVLDRLSTDILPRIHHNVKNLILEPMSMERILLAVNYTNLTSLKLFNFRHKIVSSYFTEGKQSKYSSIKKKTIRFI
ncbi:unnamed protein product [Rotaria sp. Silwood2]|nr:unnamed protein product [Rotaria sp. Silwood2]CAF4269678.1 unnamed protein product [Rotaria sp. Silwood2]